MKISNEFVEYHGTAPKIVFLSGTSGELMKIFSLFFFVLEATGEIILTDECFLVCVE